MRNRLEIRKILRFENCDLENYCDLERKMPPLFNIGEPKLTKSGIGFVLLLVCVVLKLGNFFVLSVRDN